MRILKAEVEFNVGESLGDCIDEAINFCEQNNCKASFEFNGAIFILDKDSNLELARSQYQTLRSLVTGKEG